MHPKTDQEIKDIKISGQIVNAVYATVRRQVAVGMTTKAVADIVAAEIRRLGGEAVLLGYNGFPDVVCISINDQVVHGIPGGYEIKSGDLVSFDLCVGYQGMITDSAFTMVAGGEAATSSRVRTALKATQEALSLGINEVKNGVRVGDISNAIERRLRRDNLGVIEDLVGHGVGHSVHEDPEVPNFGVAGRGPTLKTGMTVAIEPMATLGSKEVFLEADKWTISTKDKSLSMHFEHTVLVTENGCEILT